LITAPTHASSITLQERVRAIQGRLADAGVTAIDMRRAGSLETDMNVPQPVDAGFGLMAPPQINRLEGPIVARPITRRNETQFRWFIDGTQKTLAVWRIGVVPVIVGIAVVGIVERDDHGECFLLGETLRERVTWFVPTRTTSPQLNRLVEVLQDAGEDVQDPLESFARDESQLPMYHELSGNYGRLLYHAQERSGKVRGEIERWLVRVWDNEIRRPGEDDWLVVDGRLSGQYVNAIGFVKDPTSQHLAGDEAAALYSLPAGHRTTAYELLPSRADDEDDDTELRNQAFTMWYQRMWPADGLDARHALIRIETGSHVQDSELIDDIATWLMAERVPRPTGDARWPTMLYPVHLLELMLKRRISAITAGWPSS
jgi:hypothetical protein